MRIAVIGTGASALAVAQRLEHDTGRDDLWLIEWNHLLNPGCPDIARWHQRIADAAGEDRIDLVVVLDRQPLTDGVADTLAVGNLACFGPTKAAAAITQSPAQTWDLLAEAGVPTAGRSGTGDAEYHAPGCEGSYLVWAFCDGQRARLWPALRRYDRAHDGDLGPVTAGMGAATLPADTVDRGLAQDAAAAVLAALSARGIDYRGMLALHIGLQATGPVVLEADTHWGDPDTQALLSVLDGPLLPLLVDSAAGAYRDSAPIPVTGDHAVCVTLADHDYPQTPRPWNLDALPQGALYRHQAPDQRHEPDRHFSVGATGTSPQAASQAAYARIDLLTAHFTGPVPLRWRTDIGTDTALEARG